MATITILGNGGLGRAVATAFSTRGDDVRVVGRPPTGRHDAAALTGADLIVEASRPDAVVTNLAATLAAGNRRLVIATTGWTGDRPTVEALVREHGAAAVAAPNFSLGVALFGRLVETAAGLFGRPADFEPYLVEWHRRAKLDRPSGTARELARRMAVAHPRLADPDDLELVSVRAGSSPGMHLVGFDAPGETIEIRHTARDRSAYAAGIVAAADWLAEPSREPGIHPFDRVVDELLLGSPVAA